MERPFLSQHSMKALAGLPVWTANRRTPASPEGPAPGEGASLRSHVGRVVSRETFTMGSHGRRVFHVKHWSDGMDILRVMQGYGIHVTSQQANQLLRHLTLVLQANRRMNLTAVTDLDDALLLHVVDSLLATPVLMDVQVGSALDLGSGAGYPGIPLAIVSGRRFVLLDSVKKKARFLEECIESLPLEDVEVVAMRAEEIATMPEYRRSFSVVTARAVTRLASLLELAAPLLKPGGSLIALKARPDEAEITDSLRAASIVGMREVCRSNVTLTDGSLRQIIRFDRVTEPQIELPRRTGLAQKRPLG